MEEEIYTSTHPLGHTGPVTESLYLFYMINLRQFNVTRTTQSYMTIHYQVNFFQFGKYVKELGKDTHPDYDLKSKRTKRKRHTSRRTRFRLKIKTKMRGTGQCKKVKFVFHTKLGLHPLDTTTSQLIDVYCEDRIDLKDIISMELVIYRKANRFLSFSRQSPAK